ncbi:hypothetical protein BGW80DRAFT_1349300 [Lactifluus volemus]|nr:hypothetical protein BGW80DRAFT_1349300 [Lactifluus volemus]
MRPASTSALRGPRLNASGDRLPSSTHPTHPHSRYIFLTLPPSRVNWTNLRD